MKLLYKLFAAAASIFALSSCVEEAIEPLTGKYEKPVTYELNQVVSQDVEKGEKTRTFIVELTDSKATLLMKFVGNKYFLADNDYTATTVANAKNGYYLVGQGGSTFTLDGTTVNVDSGSLTVKQNEGLYTFTGTLWLADESIIKINSTVTLVYEADPEPVKLTQVSNAYESSWVTPNTITMELADADLTFTESANGPIYAGSGTYLQLMLYSPDKYLHEGTYTASTSGEVVNEGEFAIGFDAWGGYWPDAGTCLCTVVDGVKTAQKLSEGTITVTRKGNKWVIEYVCGEGKSMIWTKFEGAIDALTDPSMLGGGEVDTTEYVELTKLQSAQSNVANGVKSLTISMATDGWEVTYDAQYNATYTGEGNYLSMDIYSEDGKLYTGTYNANTVGGVLAAGEFGIGYDTTVDWGWGPMEMKDWGTCWWTVDNAAPTAQKVLDGTVEVLVEGANLVIKLKSTLVNAKFTYPVADFKDGKGNAIEVI